MSHPLSSRQEAFCRQFAASGNAAAAARLAGYAVGSARQTGHVLLDKPWIIERVRAIRLSWRQTARREAALLLARLEQAWDAAVAANNGRGNASQMLQVIRLQAEIAGLTRKGQGNRAELWPTAEDVVEEQASETAAPPVDGPMARAVRAGRHAAERSLARERTRRRAHDDRQRDDRQQDDRQRDDEASQRAAGRPWDALGHLETCRRLTDAIEARRTLLRQGRPTSLSKNMTHHDNLAVVRPSTVAPLPTIAENSLADAEEAAWLAEGSGPQGAGRG